MLVLTLGAFGAARARAVTVTDLGPLVPLGMNNNDQVVGDVLNSSANTNHAELWSNGTLSLLPEPSGASGSDAYEINQAGRIVGDDVFPVTSEVDALYWDPGTTATRIPPVQTGGATDFSQANSVDVAGDMVGRILSGSMPPQDVGFIDKSGALTFVGGNDTPQNGASLVGAITPDGSEMLGEVTTTSTYYLWSGASPHGPGTALDITPQRAAVALLPGIAYGADIENALAGDGTVLGFKGPISTRTFWIRAPSGTETQVTGLNPFAVNSSHTVAGLIQTGNPSDPVRAGIWSGGTVTDLNMLLPANSGWELTEALTINDKGDIAGLGIHDGVVTAFLLATSAQVSGTVLDRDGNAISGITLTLTGTDDKGNSVQRTSSTNAAGFYSFIDNNAGSYTVTATGDAPKENGGSLAAAQCDGTPTNNACALVHAATGAQLTANFTYTLCDSSSRDPNGSPVTDCPIIFIPGFLGTKIACDGQELWPNFPRPDFTDMRLTADGFTDAGAPGTCGGDAQAVQGPAGLVSSVAGSDVYGSTFDFLVSLAGASRMDVFTFDWRRSPQAAVAALDQEVDRMLTTTGATRVVIMAHSMGGLVTRAYIDDPAHADKVERVLTLGTPYWGAPKAIFALLEGDTETPAIAKLDALNLTRPGFANELQAFARTSEGMFWLYPSERYGPWMTVTSLNSGHPMVGAQIDPWIQTLGGTSALLDQARAGHQQLDGFVTNGIDYQAVVGTGLATPTGVDVDTNSVSSFDTVDFGSGDGTVPAVSGTQGGFNGGAPLGANVPIHYVCGVPHMELGGNPGVDARIGNFLLKGSDIPDTPADNCPYSGSVVEVYHLNLPVDASISSAGHSMSVTQAVDDNLITVLHYGGRDIIITDDRLPVTLSLHGRGMSIAVQRISSRGDGRTVGYGPLNGTVDVGESGAVSRGGHKLRSHRPQAKPPVTTARVKRHGKRYVVTLRARGSGGVGAIFYRIGKRRSQLYRKPLILTAAQVRALRFSSVGPFGRVERVRRIRHL